MLKPHRRLFFGLKGKSKIVACATALSARAMAQTHSRVSILSANEPAAVVPKVYFLRPFTSENIDSRLHSLYLVRMGCLWTRLLNKEGKREKSQAKTSVWMDREIEKDAVVAYARQKDRFWTREIIVRRLREFINHVYSISESTRVSRWSFWNWGKNEHDCWVYAAVELDVGKRISVIRIGSTFGIGVNREFISVEN